MSYASGLARALRAGKSCTASPSRLPTMPQHSLGASARAWATIRPSIKEAIRIPERTLAAAEPRSGASGGGAGAALRRLQRRHVVVVVVLVVATDGFLELAHPATERLAGFRKPLRAQDDERDDEHDHQLERTDVERHLLSPFPFSSIDPRVTTQTPVSSVFVNSSRSPSRSTTRCCAPPAMTIATVRSGSSSSMRR